MKETQAVFKPLLERLGVASGKLEQELVSPPIILPFVLDLWGDYWCGLCPDFWEDKNTK